MTHALDAALGRAERGVLLYGITPPRRATQPEQADEIAQRTLARLTGSASTRSWCMTWTTRASAPRPTARSRSRR